MPGRPFFQQAYASGRFDPDLESPMDFQKRQRRELLEWAWEHGHCPWDWDGDMVSHTYDRIHPVTHTTWTRPRI